MPVSEAQTTWAWDWLRLRRRHRLTQTALAKLLGVSLTTVWNVERGRRVNRPPWLPLTPGKRVRARFRQLQKQLEREQPELPWEE